MEEFGALSVKGPAEKKHCAKVEFTVGGFKTVMEVVIYYGPANAVAWLRSWECIFEGDKQPLRYYWRVPVKSTREKTSSGAKGNPEGEIMELQMQLKMLAVELKGVKESLEQDGILITMVKEEEKEHAPWASIIKRWTGTGQRLAQLKTESTNVERLITECEERRDNVEKGKNQDGTTSVGPPNPFKERRVVEEFMTYGVSGNPGEVETKEDTARRWTCWQQLMKTLGPGTQSMIESDKEKYLPGDIAGVVAILAKRGTKLTGEGVEGRKRVVLTMGMTRAETFTFWWENFENACALAQQLYDINISDSEKMTRLQAVTCNDSRYNTFVAGCYVDGA
jgi:hypothetical protein